MARWRLGVVILLPKPLADEVNGLRRALGDGGLAKMAPHITLVPPVNVREDELGNAVDVLRAAANVMTPFEVELGPVRSFRPESPTLKLDVGPVGRVSVHRLRNAVFVPPFERSLTFPFVPHVTVADELDEERTAAAMLALPAFRATMTVDRVWIMRERERFWQPVADAALGKPTVIGRGGRELELSVTQLIDPATARACELEPEHATLAIATSLVITARSGGAPIGVVAGIHEGGVFRLTFLRVVEHERGFGVGAQLMRELLRTIDASFIVNQGAVSSAFLQQYGFVDDVLIHRGFSGNAT